ncbi:type VI secretion system baseplate subunit TssF [Xenorhabdus bovienii]|uniref:Type VI secretion protein n=1 Tax=Xenorhabdus bovienii str. feltiae Moldova TaxID=1398200 RepID=A0A077NRD4_XENBV|nr:type VI secretion system baseplate subunit TssF [Xenorhabdus bovienii]CDH01425.1 conserved hypothetical protein [Xenorhabdus bovienii str. feltiae Moldova]
MKNTKESLYLKELAYMRERAKLMAAEFPHLENFLNTPHDPDVERLLEGFALLSSNLRSTIEDSYPEITHEMLGRIWPHALRPVPPTTIIQFTPHKGIHQGAVDIPRGTSVTAAEGEQVLRFRTCRPLHIEPFIVLDRQIQKTREHSEIILTLRQTGEVSSSWKAGLLQFFLGTDRERTAQLSLWLERHLGDIFLRTKTEEKRLRYSQLHGCDAHFNHSVLPTDNTHFARLQLITEYYCLPYAFDFVTFDAQEYRELPLNPDGSFELVFRLEGELPLDTLGDAFQLGCVPAVHLEPIISLPLQLDENQAHYPLTLQDTVRLFQLQDVQTVKQPGGKQLRGKARHFQSVARFCEKSDWLLDEGQPENIYFQSLLSTDLLGRIRNGIRFLGVDGEDAKNLPSQTVCAHLTGYHVQAMTLEAGDITVSEESVPAHLRASNITPVSPDFPPMVMGKPDWSLIGVLNNTPFLIFNTDTLKTFLGLFDCYGGHNRLLSQKMQHDISGIVHLEATSGDRIQNYTGRPIRGYYLHLTLNSDCYDTEGHMYRFAQVIGQVLSCFVIENNFIQLNVYHQNATTALWQFRQMEGLRNEM